ncbi:MAG TPA: nucleotidyltransferase domain-containing protein [Spirochaetia bacterium]|nr:nucleotidyltransferase domain-containing protein [Spirochaetia bacterium]
METYDDDFLINEDIRHTLPPEQRKVVIQDITRFLQECPGILFAYLHGSFEEDSFFRDVDVAVYFDETVPAERHSDHCSDLAGTLSRLAGFPVDIHALNQASPGFRYHATKGLVLWSRDGEKRCEFLEQTWMTYFDYQPVQRQILDDLLADLDSQPGKQATGKDRHRDTA